MLTNSPIISYKLAIAPLSSEAQLKLNGLEHVARKRRRCHVRLSRSLLRLLAILPGFYYHSERRVPLRSNNPQVASLATLGNSRLLLLYSHPIYIYLLTKFGDWGLLAKSIVIGWLPVGGRLSGIVIGWLPVGGCLSGIVIGWLVELE